jgi:signal transduction histidine kinase
MTTLQSVTNQWGHRRPQQGVVDLAPSLKSLLKSSVELLGADEATLRLRDESGNAISTLAYRRASEDAASITEVQVCPVSDVALRSRQRIAVEDVSADVRFQHSASLYAAKGIAAVHSMPLSDRSGRCIGVFTTRFAHPHCLSEPQIRALQFSAEALAMVFSSGQREEQARASSEGLREWNAELESANTRLVRSNQDLERFALAASHDLKEPLRTVAAYAQLLSVKHKAQLDDHAAGLVSGIIQSAERMSALLRDLMTYAEVGASGEDGMIHAVDLNLVLGRAIQNLNISAAESDASITADPLPTVAAPETHLLQLFQNLISNAINYRSEFRPRIHITSLPAAGQLEFVVSDNGIGIDPQYHARIFEAFRRLGDSESTGTGMGLTICQRIVQRYGGRIWVESQKGAGAAFHFTLPNIAVVPVAGNRSASEYPLERKPVVILIDDNPADVRLFKLALSEAALDCQLTVIEDGEEALTFVSQAAAGLNGGVPDAMVLDAHLPKRDGIEVLEAMAASPVFASVPAVVWSSGSSPDERENFKRFSSVTYMDKPTRLEEFLRVGLGVKELLRGQLGRSGSV